MKKILFVLFLIIPFFAHAVTVCMDFDKSISFDFPNGRTTSVLESVANKLCQRAMGMEPTLFSCYFVDGSFGSSYSLNVSFKKVYKNTNGSTTSETQSSNQSFSTCSVPTPVPTPKPCESNQGSPVICGQTGTFSVSKLGSSFCSGGCVQKVTSSYLTGYSVNPSTKQAEYTFKFCHQATTTQCDGSYGPDGGGGSSSDPKPSSTPNPSSTPAASPTKAGASCPDGKTLIYVNGVAKCYEQISTQAPNSTSVPNPTSSPTDANTTSTTDTTTVTNPDGSKTTSTVTTNPDGSSSTTTTTTKPDGSSTSSTKTSAASSDLPAGKEDGECTKEGMSGTVSCEHIKVTNKDSKKYDDAKVKEDINTAKDNFKNGLLEIKNNLKSQFALSFNSSGAPQNYTVSLRNNSFSFGFDGMGSYFSKIGAMVIAIAYLVGIFIILV